MRRVREEASQGFADTHSCPGSGWSALKVSLPGVRQEKAAPAGVVRPYHGPQQAGTDISGEVLT
ncbi:hypothetical protein GCM10010343_07970 [Streptomyces avidinii]|nr:hypothetical protein GCM10010343_07970 [Streptomyces avidinii]